MVSVISGGFVKTIIIMVLIITVEVIPQAVLILAALLMKVST